jgi:hypothetical protein
MEFDNGAETHETIGTRWENLTSGKVPVHITGCSIDAAPRLQKLTAPNDE